MAGIVRGASRFLKNAWDKEPIIVVSFAFGLTGMFGLFLSPNSYKQEEEMRNVPNAYNYYGLPRVSDNIFEKVPLEISERRKWKTDYDD